MIIPPYAKKAMQDDGINEEEVRHCLKHGELEIKQLVKGEIRYGKRLDLKHISFMVIYTLRNNKERVITVYSIRRKKSW